MTGLTLVLVCIGAGTVAYFIMKIVDMLDNGYKKEAK